MMSCNTTTTSTRRRARAGWALSVIALVAVGCANEDAEEGSGRRQGDRVVTVETEPVEQRDWQLVARTVGSLAADERVEIRNEVAGRIVTIEAQEGELVTNTQVLLRIDDERARLNLQRAEAQHKQAEANLRRLEPLYEKNLITEAELIEAESAFETAEAERGLMRRQLEDTTIRAPMHGQLSRRHLSPGDYVNVATPLFDLVKIDTLKLDFDLPIRFLPLLATGQQVRVQSNAYPDRPFDGAVYFIDPIINEATRTVAVRARIANEDRALRPNLFVNVALDVTLIEDALVVPEEAVISDLGGYSLYVVDNEDQADFRRVTLGEREPGAIQITEGVEAGERVVAAGHQRLQPGVRVTERSEKEEE